mmetsp:Transcript_6660/g.24693  ORF Transcript_6660/g.24693 Transcript_6660/m.24693 type:complete len:547 (+) Transcript_6660:74-1714(+)
MWGSLRRPLHRDGPPASIAAKASFSEGAYVPPSVAMAVSGTDGSEGGSTLDVQSETNVDVAGRRDGGPPIQGAFDGDADMAKGLEGDGAGSARGMTRAEESFHSLPGTDEERSIHGGNIPALPYAASKLGKDVTFSANLEDTAADDTYQGTAANWHTRNVGDYTVIAFINPVSGGRLGKELIGRLRTSLGEPFVFDLSRTQRKRIQWKPEKALQKFAGDAMVRVLVCGGDGTMAWLLSAIDRVAEETKTEKLGIAIMPLGTGNDLSRTFGWGSGFKASSSLSDLLAKVERAEKTELDRWRLIAVPSEQRGQGLRRLPTNLEGALESAPTDVNAGVGEARKDGPTPSEEVPDEFVPEGSIDNVFCNYFSVGIDARVSYAFHNERQTRPQRFSSQTKNKMIYVEKALSDGGYCSCTGPEKSLLSSFLQVEVDVEGDGNFVPMEIPKGTRGIVVLNLRSYAGGSDLAGRGTYHDGKLQIVYISNMRQMGRVLGLNRICGCVHAPHFAECKALKFRFTESLHMQVDGEPWFQSPGVLAVSYYGKGFVYKA